MEHKHNRMIVWDSEGYAVVYPIKGVTDATRKLEKIEGALEACAQIYTLGKLRAIKRFNSTDVVLMRG